MNSVKNSAQNKDKHDNHMKLFDDIGVSYQTSDTHKGFMGTKGERTNLQLLRGGEEMKGLRNKV